MWKNSSCFILVAVGVVMVAFGFGLFCIVFAETSEFVEYNEAGVEIEYSAASITKWKYRIISVGRHEDLSAVTKKLNQAGNKGWELIFREPDGTFDELYYFKQPK